MRGIFIRIAEAITWVFLIPCFLWGILPFSENSTFTAVSQLFSFIPGTLGILMRRVWYRQMLRRCGTHLTVEWLGVIRIRYSEIGDHCTIGVSNWVGWVRMGNNVMMGSHIVLLSGGRQHAFDDLTTPMRLQHGEKRQLIIGDDVWIGAHAVVLTDVSPGTVIGAGSIVTKVFSERAIVAGNPASVIHMRGEPRAQRSE
jgi:acetyltransferase-like isoleucine patch superfamily enzyme